jgi:hypothetical protein
MRTPTYDELLKENALLRLEIAEAMQIAKAASLVNGEGNEIVTSLVSRVKGLLHILQTETDYSKELEKQLGINREPQNPNQLDLFDITNEPEIKCGTCSNKLTLVRPGKHQCDYCEGMAACNHFGLCVQKCYPSFGNTCSVCPLRS